MMKHSVIFKRKMKVFFSQKRAIVGISIFSLLFLSSLFANFISNDKPLLYISNKNKITSNKYVFHVSDYTVYFPVMFSYEPEDFGIEDAFVVNYKTLIENNSHSFYIFPLNKWNAEEQTSEVLNPPSKEHFLGTDNLGRDIFARLLYGVRTSLFFGLLLWIISYSIGVFVGLLQGYLLGWIDFLIERLKELSAIIPTLTLIILVTGATNHQSFELILFLILIFAWMGISSQIRASTLSLSKMEYCEAAKAMGASHLRIMKKHILANSLVPIITLSPFAIEGGISLLASLDYLGFGLPPPTPSLGELMSQGRDVIQSASWVLISPIVAILLLLVSINLIGQSLRDAFDPRKG